jgi:hypothetical protein
VRTMNEAAVGLACGAIIGCVIGCIIGFASVGPARKDACDAVSRQLAQECRIMEAACWCSAQEGTWYQVGHP